MAACGSLCAADPHGHVVGANVHQLIRTTSLFSFGINYTLAEQPTAEVIRVCHPLHDPARHAKDRRAGRSGRAGWDILFRVYRTLHV